MKYRVIDPKGCYIARDPTPVRLELGADAAASKVYGVRAPVSELVGEGEVIEGAHLLPGPHLEPLDDEAADAMRQYRRLNPGATLDPTNTLPTFGGGLDDLVGHQLDRLLREASGPRPDEVTALRAELAEMRLAMAAMVASQAAPAARRAVT
jgi:hypothetical protein